MERMAGGSSWEGDARGPALFAGVRALVFDVDGTLYRPGPVRRGVLLRFLAAHALRPWAARGALRALLCYRRVQEDLRAQAESCDLATAQLEIAAARSGIAADRLAALVQRWMEQRPLALMRRARREGLLEFLEKARGRGLRLGAVSDYPAAEKLHALGVAEDIQAVACAQDRDVGLFKPHPRGLELVLGRLGVAARDALFVGDRACIDGEAARRAGTAFALIGGRDEDLATLRTEGLRGAACASYPALAAALWPAPS